MIIEETDTIILAVIIIMKAETVIMIDMIITEEETVMIVIMMIDEVVDILLNQDQEDQWIEDQNKIERIHLPFMLETFLTTLLNAMYVVNYHRKLFFLLIVCIGCSYV